MKTKWGEKLIHTYTNGNLNLQNNIKQRRLSDFSKVGEQ